MEGYAVGLEELTTKKVIYYACLRCLLVKTISLLTCKQDYDAQSTAEHENSKQDSACMYQ